VRRPLNSRNVLYVGLDRYAPHEAEVIDRLGLKWIGSDALLNGSAPVVDWMSQRKIKHLAIHFDLDVLDPNFFRPLLFNLPELPAVFADVPRGRLRASQVTGLLKEVATKTDIVGLAVAEHILWDMIALRDMLAELPLLCE
jgi:arginase